MSDDIPLASFLFSSTLFRQLVKYFKQKGMASADVLLKFIPSLFFSLLYQLFPICQGEISFEISGVSLQAAF